ncbi:MAG TPA: hypothetical protein VGP47_05325 [Parachlamydiaceae bacterium]|nr:hypothetical protein [Parachlamydiaceae bacterium]
MSTVSIGIYNQPFQNPTAIPADKEKTSSMARRYINLTYSKCERAWSYLGKTAILTRHFLNAASKNMRIIAVAGMDFPKVVSGITTHMKLLSIVSIPFSLGDITSTARKILNSLFLNDKEGMILSTLSFTVIAADIADSFTTFVNTTLILSAAAPVAFFSLMGLPLGFTMAGLGTISRTVQIAKSTILYRSISREVLAEKPLNKDFLKAFIEKTLGIDEELKSLLSISPDQLTLKQQTRMQLLKDNNKAAILRAAPGESLKELESLLEQLEGSTEDSLTPEKQKEVMAIFKKIQKQIIKKMKIDGLSICANLFSLAALILFSVGIATSTPFALLVVAFAIRLGIVIYQNQKTASVAKVCIGNP